MTTLLADARSGGFPSFYREYARTGIHAATAAALTLFGTMTIVHRGFAVLAVAVYVLPPVYLYLTGDERGRSSDFESESGPEPEANAKAEAESESELEPKPEPELERKGDAGVGSGSDRAATSERPSETASASRSSAEPEPEPVTTPEPGTRTRSGTEAIGTGETATDAEPGTESGATTRADTESTHVGTAAREAGVDTNTDTDTDTEIDTGGGSSQRADADARSVDGTTGDADGVVDDPGDGDSESEEADVTAVPESSDLEPSAEWIEAESPVGVTLYAVAIDAGTDGEDATYAAGADGTVLARSGSTDGWEAIIERGPSANGNALRGVDVTADGGAVWVCGDSGVLGRYDTDASGVTDFSAPNDQTSTWEAIAVSGPADEEAVHLVNGSGAVLRGEYEDGAVEWGDLTKPGSGSSMTAIAVHDRDRGYCCDSNGTVFETTDGGRSYEPIGVENADTAFYDVAPAAATVVVCGGDGSVHRYDGTRWTRRFVDADSLHAIDVSADERTGIDGLAGSEAGTIYERRGDAWEAADVAIDGPVYGVATGVESAVAVGEDGAIRERR